MKAIARIQSDFETKFGIPRQSGLIDELKSVVVFEPEFRNPDALRGLEEYSHIWLIWEFSRSPKGEWSPLVRPPRLGGNVRKGVFATRSPVRPNPIGLSCVRLESIREHGSLGHILHISGADLMSGTPILDIKPYLPDTESHPEATGGLGKKAKDRWVEVICKEEYLELFSEEKRAALLKVLAEDPRPAYQDDPERIYGMVFAGHDVRFVVRDGVLAVQEVMPLNNRQKDD